jgi:GTP-binding protein
MVDSCLLLVDAAEGPMPQTRFVLRKALALGLEPIVVINKVDRKDARPDEVVSLTFDLMVELGARRRAARLPHHPRRRARGRAWREGTTSAPDLTALFETILEHAPRPAATPTARSSSRSRTSTTPTSSGASRSARAARHGPAGRHGRAAHAATAGRCRSRLTKVYTHLGLQRIEAERVFAGDIVALTGHRRRADRRDDRRPREPRGAAGLTVDEPTVSVTFSPNTSPFAGRDGRYVTSRHIAERLERELLTNVALRVEPLGGESYRVSGRGELHLSILIEQMRREGYEFSVSRPQVIMKTIDGVRCEPFEKVVADVPSTRWARDGGLSSRRAASCST